MRAMNRLNKRNLKLPKKRCHIIWSVWTLRWRRTAVTSSAVFWHGPISLSLVSWTISITWWKRTSSRSTRIWNNSKRKLRKYQLSRAGSRSVRRLSIHINLDNFIRWFSDRIHCSFRFENIDFLVFQTCFSIYVHIKDKYIHDCHALEI